MTCETCKDGYTDKDSKCDKFACKVGDNGSKNCATCTEANGTTCASCSDPKNYKPKDGKCVKNGLSGGAIAGIVIAVLVVAVASHVLQQ